MTCDQNIPSDKPNFQDLPNERLIEVTIELLEQCLRTFKSDLIDLCPTLKDYEGTILEIIYNFCLSHFLKRTIFKSDFCGTFIIHDQPINIFELLKPNNQIGLPRTPDFGVFLPSGYWLYSIEGKRLGGKYDKQYVSGNTGGVCRFKKEQHGKNHEKACIVGYLEIEDFSFWHRTINRWIVAEQAKPSDLNWGENELLQPMENYNDSFSKCHSTHARITKMPIELVHFWVNVN